MLFTHKVTNLMTHGRGIQTNIVNSSRHAFNPDLTNDDDDDDDGRQMSTLHACRMRPLHSSKLSTLQETSNPELYRKVTNCNRSKA